MTEQSTDDKFLNIVGQAIASLVGMAVVWLAGGSERLGSALMTVLTLIGGIAAIMFSMIYQRYLGVLASGGAQEGSPAREDYDTLRESLSGENLAARIYKRLLRAFLDRIDRFFGDIGMADRTLLPHFFGLRTPAPLWTAPAFDRCLLLALIYPIVTIVLIWVISGHIGPAEAALHFPSGRAGWERAAGLFLLPLSLYAWSRCYRAQDLIMKLTWFALALALASAVAGAFALAVTGAIAAAGFVAHAIVRIFGYALAFVAAVALIFAGIIAAASAVAGGAAGDIVLLIGLAVAFTLFFVWLGPFSGTLVTAFFFAGATAYAIAVFNSGGAVAAATAFALVFIGVLVAGLAFAVVVALVFSGAFFSAFAISNLASGQRYSTILVIGMLAVVVVVPAFLASGPFWSTVGPLLLFICLLTLINAPFDWVSLGLTRALLHRGLELGGWWPYVFALTDAALAVVIITILAAAMVIGVQAFDALTVHSGGEPVLQLRALFDGVSAHPSEPEYWWLYALLISSMIPSILNLAIGGIAFLRGIPGLPLVVLRFLPAGSAVAPFNRSWIALVLTVQTFFGIGLGLAAQALLAIGLVGYGLPWLGFRVLDVARDLSNIDLPERVWTLIVS